MSECSLSPPYLQSDRTGNSFIAILLFHHFLGRDDLDWLATFSEFNLCDEERKALVSAREVGAIDNSSYRNLNRGTDTLNASKHLRRLCDQGLLQKKGQGSGTYYVPTERVLASWNIIQSKGTGTGPPEVGGEKPSELAPNPSEFDSEGSNSTDDHSDGSVSEPQLPVELAEAIKTLGKRAPETAIKSVVRKLCAWNDLALPVLARLLNRSEVYLRQKIVSPMVRSGELEFTIPEEPNHPRQRYRTAFPPPDAD